MSVLIVAIPLFGRDMTVKAYRLCDHSPDQALDTKNDFRGKTQGYNQPGLELIQQIGLEPFAGDMPLFVDSSRFHVLTGMYAIKNIPVDKLILTLPQNLEISSEILMGLEELLGRGYSIAVDGYPEGGTENHLVGFARHVILDFNDEKFVERFNEARKALSDKQIIVANIPDMDTYEMLSHSARTLFTGSFYKNPVTSGSVEISPLKVNALRLMKQINEEDFDLQDIAQTVERDPALSISLLSFINSSAVGLSSKVDSINNAVAILGQKAVQRWATIAISIEISQDRPDEVTKLSLVRAKFAENLAHLFEMAALQNSLFMTGLFSLLDIILEQPMEEAIKEVAVDNMVRDALVGRTGSLYKVMELIYMYEHADWQNLSIMAIQNNIKSHQIGQAFVDALIWYHQLLVSIDKQGEERVMIQN